MDPFGYHHFHVFLRCVHLRGPFVCREGEIHSNYLIQYPSAIIETDSTSTVFLQAASSHLWCRNSGIDLPLNFSEFQWALPSRRLSNASIGEYSCKGDLCKSYFLRFKVWSYFVTTFRCNSGMQCHQDVPKHRALGSGWLHLQIFWFSALSSQGFNLRIALGPELFVFWTNTKRGSVIVAPINILICFPCFITRSDIIQYNSWPTHHYQYYCTTLDMLWPLVVALFTTIKRQLPH